MNGLIAFFVLMIALVVILTLFRGFALIVRFLSWCAKGLTRAILVIVFVVGGMWVLFSVMGVLFQG